MHPTLAPTTVKLLNVNNLLIKLLCLALLSLTSAFSFATTEEVFEQYQDSLLQIRIIDKSTNSKSTIGSGFFIDQYGTIATNYHVIAKHVFKPEQYRIEYVSQDGVAHEADLIHIDVIHDLALLSGDAVDTPFLKISNKTLNKGMRIYTLGNPLDLGMTIVEGTYNGLTKDTMNERILLSGALNSGMSGGPSVIEDGSVIGVNVATAGNGIGFLVPQKFLVALAKEAKNKTPKDFMEVIQQQLLSNQAGYLDVLSNTPFPTKLLGSYTVPAKIASYINCWGDSKQDDAPYRKSNSYCATKNNIYLNGSINTGTIRYNHQYFEDVEMGRFRFAHLVQTYFSNPSASLSGGKENFTEYNCKSDYVTQQDMLLKTAICLKEYKKFPGLYDMILIFTTLNENDKALISTLALAGVSYENAVKFSKHYLGSFAWKRP
ncbi:Serine protease precursor MucD/AlgY associated with sigma factor RpoE [hydrothermal vent metagenome]|uniref:Serine protease MucD/AlgY associated with sigma factor RpoE n=1 Tax=hydrothermal vent metagenome TaxID=652676 RepID=A0A3B1ANS8_9ZZZZ